MKQSENFMELKFPSRSANEAFARAAVASFAAQLDPTLDELGDIKTAVSEAVTNCIVHAYPDCIGTITLRARLLPGRVLDLTVRAAASAFRTSRRPAGRCSRPAAPSAAAWASRSWRAL